MTDVREDILMRLVEIAGTIPTIVTADRNNPDTSEMGLPAAVIFDGDEETNDATDATMRAPNRATMVRMTPAIEIAALSNVAGSDLSMLRRETIKRVLKDANLSTIVRPSRDPLTGQALGGNGAIRYLGCQTDFQWMRSINGVLRVQFLFRYALFPDDL
jgi:hypothetical protein